MISQDQVRSAIDAVTGLFFYALVRIVPVAFSVIGTYTTAKGYIAGQIPINGAIQQLGLTYTTCAGLHIGGLLLRTKTAEIAAAPKPAASIPNLPPTVASLATKLEVETTRETGETKVQK